MITFWVLGIQAQLVSQGSEGWKKDLPCVSDPFLDGLPV